MSQVVEIFVLDQFSNPIPNAHVLLSKTDGSTPPFGGIADGNGKYSALIDEGEYVVSASKDGFFQQGEFLVSVDAPPVPLPAEYHPPVSTNYPAISSNPANIKVGIDAFPDTVIDVAGGDGTVLSLNELVSNINSQLSLVDPSLSAVAFPYADRFLLSSPTTGSSSKIRLISDGSFPNDVSDIIFGDIGFGVVEYTGADSPTDWNSFDVYLQDIAIPSSTDPSLCTVWDRAGESSVLPSNALEIQVHQLLTPVQEESSVSLASSIHIPINDDDIFHFEVRRGAKYQIYLPWLDAYYEVTIPDSSSVRFSDLISPTVTSITIANGPVVNLNAGKQLTLTVKGESTLGQIMDLPEPHLLSLSTSDSSIVEIVNSNIIRAVSQGSALVTASYVNTYGTTIQSDPVTVIVP